MSKSKGNVVSPDEMVGKYGADSVRSYVLFMGPAESDAEWTDKGIEGVYRFLGRVWRQVTDAIDGGLLGGTRGSGLGAGFNAATLSPTELALLVKTPGVARRRHGQGGARKRSGMMVRLLEPFAPHMGAELWEMMGRKEIWDAPWPQTDARFLTADVLAAAKALPGVAKYLDGVTVVKEVVVPGRLVSLVVKQ